MSLHQWSACRWYAKTCRRAVVDVALRVEAEVFAAEGPVLLLGLVVDRDVRRDVSVVDQPLEVGTRTVGRIAGEPFRLKAEAFLGALDPDASR